MRYMLSLICVIAVSFALAGCGGKGGSPSGPTDGGTGSTGEGTIGSGSSARDAQQDGNFLDVDTFPQNLIVQGCPGVDCIPALTDPTFVDASSADAGYLRDTDLVMGVVANGEAKAYPHNIGWWHEVVNDKVGEQPVVVSLCPLTGTGMVFDGKWEDGERLYTGVSGLLFNNNLVMYDRPLEGSSTLFPQMIHKGIVGPRQGQALKLMPVVETTWSYWKALYPNTKVISGNTGVHSMDQYMAYPYIQGGADYRIVDDFVIYPLSPSYDENQTSRFFRPKHMTLGVRFDDLAKAYPFPSLGTESVINDRLAGNDLVVVYYAREELAIPYYRKIVDNNTERILTFEKVASSTTPYPFMMKDKETGSTWNLKGEAVSGALSGKQLTQIPAHNAFWFAWSTFWRNTGVF